MADPFYNKTVTIWNKYTDGLMETEHWTATVIRNARLLVNRGTNIQVSGNSAADSCRLHIDDKLSKSSKPFKSFSQWDKLLQIEKEDFYTLDDKGSFFTEGDSSYADPYAHDNFFEFMKENYDNVFRMSNVDRFDIIPHWEVWGK